ncbi:MAG: response regulator transcription factor [Burkholderiales bacterium]|uniref:response regulator transcription factor n=1 Tax=Inhella sp. TaxID=1921806 RepID=UPI001AC9414C|nr:response regulator transcription factor [Burkholderiales bacterium]
MTNTVYLVDDEDAVREALAFLLGSRGLAVQAFDAAPALLAHLDGLGAAPQGVFLLDVRMEPMNGTRLHEALLERGLKNPVLFLTGHGDIPMVVAALKRGAFDFLEKPYSDNALVDRVEQALAVAAAMQAQGAHAAERAARLASLTEREREVMQRVAAGKLNKVIADELCVSVRTVEVHRARVFAKLGVGSAAELAGWLAGGG